MYRSPMWLSVPSSLTLLKVSWAGVRLIEKRGTDRGLVCPEIAKQVAQQIAQRAAFLVDQAIQEKVCLHHCPSRTQPSY
jgi:hypothetical protein